MQHRMLDEKVGGAGIICGVMLPGDMKDANIFNMGGYE